LKAKDWDTYKGKINESSAELLKLSQEDMKFALNFLEMPEQDYARFH